MTSKILVAVLGLVLTLSLCSAQNRKNNGEQAIKTLERELEAALLKGDSITLDRILRRRLHRDKSTGRRQEEGGLDDGCAGHERGTSWGVHRSGHER